MKKLFTLAFLAIGMMANAQKDEMSTISLQLDPSATIKEGSANIYVNIEYVGKLAYINANVQLLDGLKGGYYDFGGTIGANLYNSKFKDLRVFTGVRLGFIKRGYKESNTYTYPLFGIEGGISKKITNRVYVVARATYDYRQDFQFSGADPAYRASFFTGVVFKLKEF